MLYKSALVTQASGSIGGLTASTNAGGNYFRARSTPTNPNTQLQAAIRAGMGYLANQWLKLTQAQRDSWATYAANTPLINSLGASIKVSGQNMFIRSNQPYVQLNGVGGGVIADAPTVYNIGATPIISNLRMVTTGDGGTILQLRESINIADTDSGTCFVQWSKPQNVTINFFKGPFQLVLPADIPSGGIDLTAEMPTFYPGGTVIFLRQRVLTTDGRLSAAVISRVVVTVDTSLAVAEEGSVSRRKSAKK